MIDSTVIVNARLPGRSGLYQISIKDGVVDSIGPGSEESAYLPQQASAHVQDVQGDWVSPGAVDLQINGALGLAFPDLRVEQLDQLQAICELLWKQGVSGFCPTLVTTSLENFHGSLTAIQTFRQQQLKQPTAKSAQVFGAHLEGPFLNEVKRGAHPKAYLQPLSLETIKRAVGDFADAISIMTLAPEQADDDDVIGWLTEQEITVSLGHSLATAAQAKCAFDQGATMVTHAFNAMPGLHHREPGLLGAALLDPRVFCGFIADGEHICKPMLDLLLRMGKGMTHSAMNHRTSNGLGSLFLVSDALSPLGLPDGHYPWDSRTIEVVNGTARLADGTLSGTTLPLVQGAINLVEWGLCSVDDALLLVTDSPRRAIGLPLLSPGSSANLLRWHQPTQGQITHQWL